MKTMVEARGLIRKNEYASRNSQPDIAGGSPDTREVCAPANESLGLSLSLAGKAAA